MRKARGFTLIEMMIVVVIVAVLGAIAISQYQDYVIRAQISEGPSLAAGAKASVVDFYSKMGHFPTGACTDGNLSVGLASPASISGTYVARVFVAGAGCPASMDAGSILAVFSSNAPQKASATIDGAGLIFEPIPHEGSIEWHCKKFLLAGAVVLKDNWLPSSCR